MTDLHADPPKTDPEALVLRAAPPAVTRISRRVVVILAAMACLVIVGATWFALKPPRLGKDQPGQELINTDRKQTPDGLAGLPRTYGDLPPPRLGAPLPGDLGPAVVGQERSLGLAPPATPGTGFRPNPVDDAARAEALRLAQQARQAREAGVMFQTAHRAETPKGTATNPGSQPVVAMPAADHPLLDPERDPNGQQRKLDFLERKGDRGITNPHALQDPLSPHEVLAGTVIAASLLTGLNSDLPGLVTAQVTENVYDTVTGKVLLIPQGARLIGSYDSVVAYGQRRALVAWQRLIMPDGSSVLIDNLPATDTAGYAGLEDGVDYHTGRLLAGIAMSTLLGVGTEISFGSQESDLARAIRQSTQNNANQAGQRITEKNLNIQPSLTVRPGWPLRVIVHKDLVLRPYRG